MNTNHTHSKIAQKVNLKHTPCSAKKTMITETFYKVLSASQYDIYHSVVLPGSLLIMIPKLITNKVKRQFL